MMEMGPKISEISSSRCRDRDIDTIFNIHEHIIISCKFIKYILKTMFFLSPTELDLLYVRLKYNFASLTYIF